LYATTAGEIGEIEIETGADVNAGPLVNAHYKDELHALAPHPIRQECLTAGDDKHARIWNLEDNKMLASVSWRTDNHTI